jgi:excisionase family DNA binding protein
MERDDELLTTGQAAAVLGCSRQHVTDLCRSGALPYRTIGTRRRIARSDLMRFASAPSTGVPRDILRQQLRSLWLHRAVAGRVAGDTDDVLAIARTNLERARALHPRSGPWIDAWVAILDDPEQVMERLTATDAEAAELRQNSPFAGVLDDAERTRILAAFAGWWRTTHAT